MHGFDPRDLRVDDVAMPVVSPTEILVDVAAIGVSFPDTLVATGKYQSLPPFPFAPGMEFSGTVISVGSDAGSWQQGDHVVGYVTHGAYAEQVIARPDELYPVPAGVPLEAAAVLSMPFLTAYVALGQCAALQPGDTVLIGGATGAVGLAAVQLVVAMGGKALACTRSPETSGALTEAGADAIIDISGTDLRQQLHDQVMAATQDKGVDVVLDALGGDFFDAAMRVTAWRGRIVIIGFAAGAIPSVRANQLLLRTISVSGMNLTSFRDSAPEVVRAAQADIFRLWEAGKLRADIVRRYRLDEAAAALDFVAAGRNDGRVILLPDGETQ
ncbi:NADPH:quinone oxidoreductase family protein [Sphingobium sp. YR768]|uniref:NADPH:quinone oxidoreductase family protein n=1 Tax=Sphingobium sp. YR768 TaxID=1884365 RepID=UPI001C432E88|nr:NADPH:quinone oxidoreductase family protein [Sphingobium sp. YR768]